MPFSPSPEEVAQNNHLTDTLEFRNTCGYNQRSIRRIYIENIIEITNIKKINTSIVFLNFVYFRTFHISYSF